MRTQLPLFPLGTVLLPGLLLPLHVFEERYRALVRELLALPEGPQRRFGVVAIRRGHEVGADAAQSLYEVGCTAELRRVQAHDDGRFDLVTTGVTRFRLHGVDASRPYLVGDVELLPEEVGDPQEAAALAGRVVALFAGYLELLGRARGADVESPELPGDPLVVSYVVAATMLLDLADRQRLLAAPDAVSRMRAELSLLKRESTMLRVLRAAPATDLSAGTHPN